MVVENKGYVASASAALRRNGGRVTPEQRLLVEILADAEGPMSVREILIKVEELEQYIERSAAFRMVDRLIEVGAVVKIGATGGVFRRDDCLESSAGFPVFFVDLFDKKAKRLPIENQTALDRDLSALVKRHQLPDADYHLELVAGRSLLAGVAS